MNTDAILTLDQVKVFYNGLQAVRNVSLEIKRGEFTALLGSNGAGKTTLLRAISGAVNLTKGFIAFEGDKINGLAPYKILELGIAHVPEGKSAFPELTVLENLKIGSYIKRARKNREENLNKVFQVFPRLGERKNQRAGSLSGGEQQMLVIGRALMSEPKLILFDEISTGLAPIVIKDLYKTIDEIRNFGITVLIVEQNTELVLNKADKVHILEAGDLVLSGTPFELRNGEEMKNAYFGTL